MFKEYGSKEDDISYKSQEETGNARGGSCFIRVHSYDMGDKFMDSLD